METEDGLEDILNPPDPASPSADGQAASPAPGAVGESIDEIVASVEAELAGQAPPALADPSATPAAPAPDVATIEKLARQDAELTSLRALVESQMAPPDPEAEGKALEAAIRGDAQIVEYNRELEQIETDHKSTQAAQVQLLRDIGTAQDQVAHFKGAASVAADDVKPSYEAKAEAAQSKVESLQSRYSQNAQSLKRAEVDQRSLERRVAERADAIQNDLSSRADQQERDKAIAKVTVQTFNSAVDSTAKGLKVDITPFDRSAIRAIVVALLHRAGAVPGAQPWTREQTQQVTAATTRKYLVQNGRTAGARAVALSPSKAPSAPRPASQRVASQAPAQARTTSAEQAALEADPEYWRRRAGMIVARGGLQGPRRP